MGDNSSATRRLKMTQQTIPDSYLSWQTSYPVSFTMTQKSWECTLVLDDRFQRWTWSFTCTSIRKGLQKRQKYSEGDCFYGTAHGCLRILTNIGPVYRYFDLASEATHILFIDELCRCLRYYYHLFWLRLVWVERWVFRIGYETWSILPLYISTSSACELGSVDLKIDSIRAELERNWQNICAN